MRRKLMLVLTGLALMGLLSGCYTQIHKVGTGAAGNNVTAKQQWFALWGLVPITQVDSNAMAAGAANYTIQDQTTAIDVIIGLFTGWVTIYPRTVQVTK